VLHDYALRYYTYVTPKNTKSKVRECGDALN